MMKKGRITKQNIKGWLSFGMTALLLVGVLTGCGSSMDMAAPAEESKYQEAYDYGMTNDMAGEVDESYEYSTEDANMDIADATAAGAGTNGDVGNSSSNVLKDSKKIIKTYNYNYETEKFDEAYEKLQQLIEEYGGYVSNSDLSGTNNRFLKMSAKIPADKSDAFAKSTGTLGTLKNKSENADDVTLEYTDTESRITSLKTEQQRLNELLKDADGLDTIIALESRMSEVRYELERYQSRKNQLDSLITYSTVNIVLEEVKYEIEVDEESFLSRISTGLKTSFRDISDGATDFAVWFIVDLPYFVIWIVIIFIIVKIVKLIRNRRRAKKEKKEIKKAQQAEMAAPEVKQDKAAEALKNDKSSEEKK